MRYVYVIFFAFIFCSTSPEYVKLSKEDKKKIGHRIWRNECNETIEGLISWHPNERFLSLGIAHFIWFPKGLQEPHQQAFPDFVNYLKTQKRSLPSWLFENGIVISCPWKNKNEFERNKSSKKMKELQKLLVDTIDEQIAFVFERFEKSINSMLQNVPRRKRAYIRKQFKKLSCNKAGMYALIDYANFKGTGNLNERYNNCGWGLLQVLENMPYEQNAEKILEDFVRSAKEILENRVKNAPKEKHEERFLLGWYNRLNTYLDPW